MSVRAQNLEQSVPVRRAAGQARHLQAEHHPDLAHADGSDEALEAFAVAVGTGLAEVAVDHYDPVGRPAQGHGPVP